MDTWERGKREQRKYSHREPVRTPLYRVVSSCAEELRSSWEELFQPAFGALRNEICESIEAYLNCGIVAHGCARAQCQNPKCCHSEIIAFSCKQRCLCPSCDAKRGVLFAENLVEEVLPRYPHQHCVFTVPKRVRPYFKFNRKLNKHLYRAAWGSWRELVLEQCPEGLPAAVQALHTAGDLLTFHSHVHGLFLSGALLPDGAFKPVMVDQKRLESLFSEKVLSALLAEGLLSPDDVGNMRSWAHSGFNVFIGDPISPSDTKRLLFAARYLKKCPVSNERLRIVEKAGSDTVIEYASYKNGAMQTRVFLPLQFLAELQQHIPDRWEQTTRFFGAYSSRTRGAKRAKSELSDPVQPLPKREHPPSRNWPEGGAQRSEDRHG